MKHDMKFVSVIVINHILNHFLAHLLFNIFFTAVDEAQHSLCLSITDSCSL